MVPSKLIHAGAIGTAVILAMLSAGCGSKPGPTPVTTTTTSPTTTTTSVPGTTTTTTSVPAGPTASFTVRSLSPAIRKRPGPNPPADPANGVVILPTGSADACPLVRLANGNIILDCRFDGAASTASSTITTYLWTYLFGPFRREEPSTSPQYRPSEEGCGFFGGRTPAAGTEFLQMIVQLQVRDSNGALSSLVSNQNVRIFPAGLCGYGF